MLLKFDHMEFRLFGLLLLFASQNIIAQIPDYSQNQPELQPLSYKGDRFRITSPDTKMDLTALVGEKVYHFEKECEIYHFRKSTAIHDTSEIEIKCENDQVLVLNQYDIDQLVFIKAIDRMTSHLQKNTYEYHGSLAKDHDLNGKYIEIRDLEKFTFTEAFYCKAKDGLIKGDHYTICIKRDNDQIFEIVSYDERIPDDGKIRLQGMGFNSFDLTVQNTPQNSDIPTIENIIRGSGIGTGGYGEGEFDVSGDGIFGRKIVYRDPSMNANAGKSGKIVFKVCINKRGVVSYLEINEFETTITDTQTLRNSLESMRKYKFEPDPSAPREQCGKFIAKVDNSDKW